jgi:hypothetical protein
MIYTTERNLAPGWTHPIQKDELAESLYADDIGFPIHFYFDDSYVDCNTFSGARLVSATYFGKDKYFVVKVYCCPDHRAGVFNEMLVEDLLPHMYKWMLTVKGNNHKTLNIMYNNSGYFSVCEEWRQLFKKEV